MEFRFSEYFSGQKEGIPIYSEKAGYGFVSETDTMPARKKEIYRIRKTEDAFVVSEDDRSKFAVMEKEGEPFRPDISTDYDFGGMVFRVKARPGAYHLEAETTGGSALVSVSGMWGAKLLQHGFWNAAETIPIRHTARWNGSVWSYDFVNGDGFIELELEPLRPETPIGLRALRITPIPAGEPGEKPTIFILGDSTVKSYVFEEAPMSGWGQLIGRHFNPEKVCIRNYSEGGRSLKSMYTEGRFNNLLLDGKKGDFVFLQSGHNDECDSMMHGMDASEKARFGRGSTEAMYRRFLEKIYLPAIRARGMTPVLVTPVTRIHADRSAAEPIRDSFTNRKFPAVMRETAKANGVTRIDLNRKSVEYLNEIGLEAAKAVFLSLEPGETPGQTFGLCGANGHPKNEMDGTHYKEALSRQYSRMVIEELCRCAHAGDAAAKKILTLADRRSLRAAETHDWSRVFPKICADTKTGPSAYYRDAIEKCVQLGALSKNADGNFGPELPMETAAFVSAAERVMRVDGLDADLPLEKPLTREVMAVVLYRAYGRRFGFSEKGKPVYRSAEGDAAPCRYAPLVPFERLKDTDDISTDFREKVEKAYRLGLIRSECGIRRGRVCGGTRLEPKMVVTKAKAAKALYFMWVLSNDSKTEDHLVPGTGPAAT